MPTYEYVCRCGEEFEELQSIKAEPVAKCPECGKQARRVVSAGAGLIFKGSGFYITDYKKKGAGGDSDAGKSSESKDAGKPSSDSKSDSSDAGKADSKKSEAKSDKAKSSPKPAKT